MNVPRSISSIPVCLSIAISRSFPPLCDILSFPVEWVDSFWSEKLRNFKVFVLSFTIPSFRYSIALSEMVLFSM